MEDIESLTDREKKVLLSLIKGETNRFIASHMFISVSTVKAHVSSIIHKLNVTNRVEAAVKGVHLLEATELKISKE